MSYFSIISLVVVSVSCGDVDCPPWFCLDSTNNSAFPQCVCSDAMQSIVTCNQRERTSYIKIGHCAYQDLNSNDTVVAYCPYVFPAYLIHNGQIRLPQDINDLNIFTCRHLERNIEALFCGRCTNGTGPSVYSFGSKCTKCSTVNILYYLLLQYFPTTIIFLAILLFRCSIVSPPMSHYILYCNIVQHALKTSVGQYVIFVNTNTYIITAMKLLMTFLSLWTLDPLYFIAPPLCISENIREIYIPLLDTIAALYPYILLLLTYILIELYARDCAPIVFVWKLSKCSKLLSSWNSGQSLIQVFATLYFLSFMKFIGIVCDSTVAANVINMKGSVVLTVSYIDPTITLFSYPHLPVGLLAIIILMFFVTPPILLLVFYPTACFRKASICFKPRWLLTIKIFTDTFHGSYKDGTNGTRDYRSIAGIIFVLWIIFPFLDGMVTLLYTLTFPWFITLIPILLASAIFCVILEPYKHRAANVSGTVLLLILTAAAGIAGTLDGYHFSAPLVLIGVIVLVLPHCVVYGYAIYWLVIRFKHHHHQGEECRPLIIH